MGHHKDHPKHKDIDTFYLNKMLHLCHLVLACVALAAAAPSSNYHHGHGIQCRTEYITLSTTEYKDIETKECRTKWKPVCKTYTETECSTEDRRGRGRRYEVGQHPRHLQELPPRRVQGCDQGALQQERREDVRR